MGVIPLLFDNVKLKYKQKANLSDIRGIVKMVSGQFATTINSPPQNSPSLESQIASLNLKSSLSSETYIKWSLNCSSILQNGKGTKKLSMASQLWNVNR